MSAPAVEPELEAPATTVCPFCGTGCGMLLEGGTAYPRRHHPVSRGALCLRGWSAGELLRSAARVVTAWSRGRGEPLRPCPVEPALEDVAGRIAALRARHGGASIGILGSARLTVEETLLLRRLAAAIGTPHLDSFGRTGYLPFPARPFDEIDAAGEIAVLAANLTVRQPQVARRLLRAVDRGATVRFVHSRRAQLSSLAARHVVAAPGRELEALGAGAPGELVLVSSEVALAGRGADTLRALAGRRALFLTDHVNQRGMVEAGLRPSPDGLCAFEMLRAAAGGALKALLVFADDPCEFFPALAARAFAGVELALVVDAVQTPTARRADVVLPGALLAEKHGTVVNAEGRAQEVVAVARPPAGWTEGAVALRLVERLGGEAAPGPPPPLAPAAPAAPAPEAPDAARPFLAALDTTLFWNSNALVAATVTAWREARSLFADFAPGCVTMNPDDARSLGVQYAGAVTLTGERGEVTLPARLHPRMLPGTVWVAMPCWERCGERLGALALDPALRFPVFVPRAVRVSRPAGA
uniref:4Fe-4S Mo/W bis-MGD-type domain-containing protein n=1 Tax=Eiseniibacteriota bacterium TaxID=2212470 RepID=A0A832MM02_UNCEI